MKRLRRIPALLLVLAGALTQSQGAAVPDSTNPALFYWQAQATLPELSESEHGHVFTNDWLGRPLDEAFGRS